MSDAARQEREGGLNGERGARLSVLGGLRRTLARVRKTLWRPIRNNQTSTRDILCVSDSRDRLGRFFNGGEEMTMILPLFTGAAWLSLTAAAVIGAQQPPTPTEVGAAQQALTNLPAKNGAKLTVTSPAFPAGGDIPFENTQYRGTISPD